MKVTVELMTNDGVIQYTMFEEANRVYVTPSTNGIAIQQDSDLPGYRISEGAYLDGNDRE